MTDHPRLIERAFPLRQASLDSVHEKNVRHGHISTLHIWPARRPLAACRAALIATLLPDPGTKEERQKLIERIGGKVVKKVLKEKKNGRIVEKIKEETEGGILHWGRENGPDLQFFRDEIRKAYGGRAPKVLDPFAGGGAIPLEAMRLGCEVTASDLNPVAWFILKCTLEYPQRLAGQKRPLPLFALESPGFMEAYFKGTGKLTKKQLAKKLEAAQQRLFEPEPADLAWHVRAWGWWVLQRARLDLERFYPTIDGKVTVAYLWARTVTCKNCRATIPLLKTLWLCKKDSKRIRLVLKPKPEESRVEFEIEPHVPIVGGNIAQRRAHDKEIAEGTMSRSGVYCPCCGKAGSVAMTVPDIRAEGVAGRLGAQMTAVVVDGENGKEYRLPSPVEVEASNLAKHALGDVPSAMIPSEPIAPASTRSISCQVYGLDRFCKLFSPRQLLALTTLVSAVHAAKSAIEEMAYPPEWLAATTDYLSSCVDKVAESNSALTHWHISGEKITGTFQRFALPMNWDFCEAMPLSGLTGSWSAMLEWIARFVEHGCRVGEISALAEAQLVDVRDMTNDGCYDAVVTDPPYYQAISYADISDFFYVWLRRSTGGASGVFAEPLTPKGVELVQHIRKDKSRLLEKQRYEDGMFSAFRSCCCALKPEGRMIIVFAHKDSDAWETLVAAMIRAGFMVTASWPIQTEMGNRTNAIGTAALASSVWLVCRKRAATARPGWDTAVLDEMKSKIHERLREFWDAHIRGPDFVWAATGPALEAYSQHPVVKCANEPNRTMSVSDFLRAVRRIVVDFVVGRVLSQAGADADGATTSGLDDVTCYYLLHRNDFAFAEAPVGASILYAQSCGLSDRALVDDFEILMRSGSAAVATDEEGADESGDDAPAKADEENDDSSKGSTVKLRAWHQRKLSEAKSPGRKNLGDETLTAPPLIDQAHKLLRLWKSGDQQKVDQYLDDRGLRRNALFHQLVQSLIELARRDNQADELQLLESLSNHVAARGTAPEPTRQRALTLEAS